MARKLISLILFFVALGTLCTIYVLSERAQADPPVTSQPRTADTKVVAYYFHVTARCTTCRIKSLVLVRFDKGRQAEYKVLNDTWELAGEKSALQGYVERETRDNLKRFS